MSLCGRCANCLFDKWFGPEDVEMECRVNSPAWYENPEEEEDCEDFYDAWEAAEDDYWERYNYEESRRYDDD